MKVDWIEIINIVIIFQILLFIIFLLRKRAQNISNYVLGCFLFTHAAGSFCDLSFLQSDFFFNNPHLAFLGYPFVFLWGPAFYLYVLTLVYKDVKLKLLHSLHLIPFVLALSFFVITFYFNSAETKRIILQDVSYPVCLYNFQIDVFFKLQILFYLILSIYTLVSIQKKLKENYSSVSKLNLSWLKFIVYGYTICFVIMISFSFIESHLGYFNKIFLLGNFLQYFIYFNIIFFKAWEQPQIFSGIDDTIKYKSSKLTKEEAQCWINRLNNYVNNNKPYLNPELTLNQLAEALNVHQRMLSQIINEYFNQNFYDYVNKLRVEESKKILLDSSSGKTIFEILLEAGFNSKATFNRAFRKETGLSPTEFKIKNAKQPVT